MLKHEQIWSAIDRLAAEHGLSASGLARRAGLDPTTFNKSKRLTSDGRQRWPSTESIAKILLATNATLDSFVALIGEETASIVRSIPLITSAEAARADAFSSEGQPTGSAWDEIAISAIADSKAFACEVNSAALVPMYREGDILIAIPGSPLRRGDRAILKRTDGVLVIGEVRRISPAGFEIGIAGTDGTSQTCATGDVLWSARIHWASQ